jgi:hypothetical protein
VWLAVALVTAVAGLACAARWTGPGTAAGLLAAR